MLHWKDRDAGKHGEQEEKGVTKNGIVGWHHLLDGCECEQIPGDSEGQEDLGCCSPCSHKESDTTEQLNNKNGPNCFLPQTALTPIWLGLLEGH